MQNQSTIRLLNFFHNFIKLGKVITGAAIIFTILSSVNYPNRINIPIQFGIRDTGITQLNDNDVLVGEGNGKLIYDIEEKPSFNYMTGFNIFHELFLVIGIFIIYFLLDKIVHSTLNKQPFIIENAKRMFLLGLVLIITGAITTANDIIGLFYIRQNFNSDIVIPLDFNSQLTKYIISFFMNKKALLGLFAILVAQILKYGVELKNENALTI